MAKKMAPLRSATILAADIVGYRQLTEGNGEGVITRQKEHRKELVDPKVAAHNGRVAKMTHHGLLLEFAYAVDAVQVAGASPQARGRTPVSPTMSFAIIRHHGMIRPDSTTKFFNIRSWSG